MSAVPDRKRRLAAGALVALAFVTGAIIGGLVTTAAASRAVEVAMRGSAELFVFDQQERLASAWNAGDMSGALAHATCAFEAGFGTGARYFDPSKTGWSLWGGALTQVFIVQPHAEVARRMRPTDEAMARARMAVILERLGRTTDAQRQLDAAVHASGIPDAARWRDIALGTISMTRPQAGDHR